MADAGRWSSPPHQPGDDAVAAWAAEALGVVGQSADALCLATLDSGARESVEFWRASRATGLAFANPRAFPWTLANSPTGRIAQSLGIRGPTFTLIGRADALTAALEHALGELASGRARRVLVAALDGVTPEESRLAAVSLVGDAGGETAATVTAGSQPVENMIVANRTASETLTAVLDRLGLGGSAWVGSDRDGWFAFHPELPS